MADRGAVVAELRRKLAAQAPPLVQRGRLEAGVPAIDARGGWPRPGLAEVSGAPGTGRLGLVLPALRALTSAPRSTEGTAPNAALVDAVGWLNPPGLPGVDLARLLLVRPGAGRAAWAAEQLARSGAFPLVILLDPPSLGHAGRRLQHAAEAGHCTVIVIVERSDPTLPARLRFDAQRDAG